MSTDLATTKEARPSVAGFTEMRWMMMSLPVEQMRQRQAEYTERRKVFREWLLSQLKEGLHFGYPPGCAPDKRIPEEQWVAKPSLYKAGAEFICDLLNVIPVFETDEEGHRQLGGKPGVIVKVCRIYPKGIEQTPENVIGQGAGVGIVGAKRADENVATKIAQKRAAVDATIRAFALSDLFTQDIEDSEADPDNEKPSNPAPRSEPRVQPRAKRDVAPEMAEAYNKLKGRWKAAFIAVNRTDPTPDQWAKFVVDCYPEIELANAQKLLFWTEDTVIAVNNRVKKLEEEG